MSCLLSPRSSPKWINFLISSKHGVRPYATKSHLLKMTKKNFETMVKSDKVVIFSKSNCCHSQAAKSLFEDIHTKYTAIELDRRQDGPFIQAHIGAVTGSPLIPKIFIVGKCVGGYCDLVELHQKGALIRLLNQDP